MKLAIGVALVWAFGAAHANVEACHSAEEAIAEMSVNVADAHQAGKLDTAKSFLEKAKANAKLGQSSADVCGCSGVKEPLHRADNLLTGATELGGDFSEVQDRLYEVIGQSERARRAAEACWRAAAAKTAQPARKP